MTATPAAPYVDLVTERLAAKGAETVLRYQRCDISAAELQTSIHRYARALAGLGIGRGDLVALFATNSPDAIAIRYASHLAGAAAVYLSVPPEPRRRADLVAQMDPQLLVVFPETENLLVPALLPTGFTVPVAAVGGDLAAARVRLDELAAAEPDAPLTSLARPEDLAVIISSGGTTAVPKGSCRSFAAYGAMVINPSPADRRQLVNGKLAYLSQVLVDTTLLGGGTVVLHDSFDADDTLAAIEDERITDLFLVEPQLFELMDHPDLDSTDLSSLRTVVHIGAAAPPTLRRRARERLGPVVAHTYGASEIGIVSALSPAEHDPAHPERFTCAGRIHPGVDVRFRRPDATLAEDGEAGSIEVRSPRDGSRLPEPAGRAGRGVPGRLVPHRRLWPARRRGLPAHPWPRRRHHRDRRRDDQPGAHPGHTLPGAGRTLCRRSHGSGGGRPSSRGGALAGLGRRHRRLPGCRRHGVWLRGRRQPGPCPTGPRPAHGAGQAGPPHDPGTRSCSSRPTGPADSSG